MIGRATFRVGDVNYEIEVEEKDVKDTLLNLIVLSNPPLYNPITKNGDPRKFKLDARKDKDGNVYINCVDKTDGSASSLGTFKSGGYFWKPFERWQDKKEEGSK